jgi:hypothetical protein
MKQRLSFSTVDHGERMIAGRRKCDEKLVTPAATKATTNTAWSTTDATQAAATA